MVKEKEVTLEPPSKNSALDKIKESIIKFINNPIQQKSSGLESKPVVPALQPPKSFPEVICFTDKISTCSYWCHEHHLTGYVVVIVLRHVLVIPKSHI